MCPLPETQDTTEYDCDVVIVGGGPAGCAAGVFTAREGLETVIFDRGRSSIQRCAYLENYLGFPAGIDIETLYELLHEHAETTGCKIVSDLVETVKHVDDGNGFVVETQEGDPVTARRVVAATRYDGEYMRGLDDDEAMFETYEHGGEEHETFDTAYADHDGTTPIEGLYVASPSDEADTQAIMAAGRGARVANRLIADVRVENGWWDEVAKGVDWVRRQAELDDEWTERETWIDWFDEYYAEDAPVAPDSERFRRVRTAVIDDSLSSYVTPDEIDSRIPAGHETLAARLDPASVVEAIEDETLLDGIDDDVIREYVSERPQFELDTR
ncbi:FAD-dependent oxidoreductase [Natronorubrum aibiense]|uniref:FAD-binding protein n=1 Tax=Natronorubrum aibiense TaxID=348826 RepID=A0A5P9P9L0_9EURY|nr:FAD-dependent oxidoreductase [Natronorubrum aibiense]QFU84825.1 FAD-binding protein [Natronorubrum aibiense]